MSEELTEDQNKAYKLLIEPYKCIFITGQAGTGKTFIINKFITEFKDIYKISITASTGIASTIINGCTIHSWSGFGINSDLNITELIKYVRRNRDAIKNWSETDILLIDEISMIGPDFLDKLNLVGKNIRSNNAPFGGIKVVITGDFYQLPNIDITSEIQKFAFEADCFKYFTICQLTKIMRQTDQIFINILNCIRIGAELSAEQKTILESHIFTDNNLPKPPITGLIPTIIDPYRKNVNQYNLIKLNELYQMNKKIIQQYPFLEQHLKLVSFKSTHSSNRKNVSENIIEMAYSRVPCEKEIILCVGAQVMLIKNIDVINQLANGSRGIVRELIFNNGAVIGCKVEFIKAGMIQIKIAEWEVKMDKTTIVIKQIPLILAYSITAHKSQGSTLDYVKLNLADCFANGQFYVMLSRVKTLDGLIISKLDYNKIKVSSKVKEFYDKLDSLE